MRSETESQEFKPELVSRRGEMIAWVSTLLVSLTWIVLSQAGQRVTIAVPLLAIILLLAALSISLGNWVDRKTLLTINPESITFRNGLRNVTFRWEDIQQVRVSPSNWGNKVQVIGKQAHFEFRTLGQVKIQGEVKGSMGFAEGDHILERILNQSNLQAAHQGGEGRADQNMTINYTKHQ